MHVLKKMYVIFLQRQVGIHNEICCGPTKSHLQHICRWKSKK